MVKVLYKTHSDKEFKKLFKSQLESEYEKEELKWWIGHLKFELEMIRDNRKCNVVLYVAQ